MDILKSLLAAILYSVVVVALVFLFADACDTQHLQSIGARP